MAHNNFLNNNEVFPILDLIGRIANKQKGMPLFIDGTGVNQGGNGIGVVALPPNLRVVKLDVTRDANNPVIPNTIVKLDIEYENGATAVLEVLRGIETPVPNTVDNHEFINHAMVRGLIMTTTFGEQTEVMEVKVIKENGYGMLQGLEIKWDGKLLEYVSVVDGISVPDGGYDFGDYGDLDDPNTDDFGNSYDDDSYNPNDFYSGGQGDENAV